MSITINDIETKGKKVYDIIMENTWGTLEQLNLSDEFAPEIIALCLYSCFDIPRASVDIHTCVIRHLVNFMAISLSEEEIKNYIIYIMSIRKDLDSVFNNAINSENKDSLLANPFYAMSKFILSKTDAENDMENNLTLTLLCTTVMERTLPLLSNQNQNKSPQQNPQQENKQQQEPKKQSQKEQPQQPQQLEKSANNKPLGMKFYNFLIFYIGVSLIYTPMKIYARYLYLANSNNMSLNEFFSIAYDIYPSVPASIFATVVQWAILLLLEYTLVKRLDTSIGLCKAYIITSIILNSIIVFIDFENLSSFLAAIIILVFFWLPIYFYLKRRKSILQDATSEVTTLLKDEILPMQTSSNSQHQPQEMETEPQHLDIGLQQEKEHHSHSTEQKHQKISKPQILKQSRKFLTPSIAYPIVIAVMTLCFIFVYANVVRQNYVVIEENNALMTENTSMRSQLEQEVVFENPMMRKPLTLYSTDYIVRELQNEVLFFDRNAKVVPVGQNFYHVYSCVKNQSERFHLYLGDSAQRAGYEPCSICIDELLVRKVNTR